jgi:hypothetical protein
MEPNQFDHKKLGTIMDLPSHQLMHVGDYLPIAKGIIFVVDHEQIKNHKTDCIRHLYRLLCHPGTKDKPFLIFYNCKGEQKLPVAIIQAAIEKELQKQRENHTKELESGTIHQTEEHNETSELVLETLHDKFVLLHEIIQRNDVSVVAGNLKELDTEDLVDWFNDRKW